MENSLAFYQDVLGMTLIRKHDYPEFEFSLAYLGYGEESKTTVLELTHNWGTDSYDLGNAYGHIAIGVDDVYKACDKIKELGGKVIREAGPMQGGDTVIAFVEDPDGYKIEILEDIK
jgi:lactoylglutathione lyase